MIEHIDRSPTHPGRVKLTPVPGQDGVFDLTREDDPLHPGAPQNKLLFDEFLAASGVTSGMASALVLAQPGFVLADGACVRLRLHVQPIPAPNVTLNVSDTGAKPVVTSKGKPFKSAVAGSWVTVVYSGAMDSFILQGKGGGSGRFGNEPGQISTYQLVTQTWVPSFGG